MNEKLNYHLCNIVGELKEILTEEISNSLQKTLSQNQLPVNELEVYLTIDELASIFKISKSHINKLRKKYKDFPVLNIDGSIRFSYSKFKEFFTEIAKNPP